MLTALKRQAEVLQKELDSLRTQQKKLRERESELAKREAEVADLKETVSQQDRDLVTLREQLDAAREAAGISTATSSSRGKGKATSSGAGGGAGARAKGKGTQGGGASSIAKLEARIDELQRELVGTRAERDSFRSQFRERLQEFIKVEMEAKTLKISSAVKDERIAIMEKVLAAAERYEWSEPWQCDVCTLMNQADAAQCSACNHPKPS